jgi:hypothetical protein
MRLSLSCVVIVLSGLLSVTASAEGVSLDCFDAASTVQLSEPFAADEAHPDPMSDPLVQQSLGRLGCLIQARYFQRGAGIADRVSAEMLFYSRMEEWLDRNPDATLREARAQARVLVVEIAEGPLMRPETAKWHPVGKPELRPADDGSGSFVLRSGQVVGFLPAGKDVEDGCEQVPVYEDGLLSGFRCADDVTE